MTRTKAIGMAVRPVEHCIPARFCRKESESRWLGVGGPAVQSRPDCLIYTSHAGMGHPFGLGVTLVDGDRISRSNCVRQPFSESEVGLYKATVLATRINLFRGLAWRASPEFLDEGWCEETDLVIECVDSRKARRLICERSQRSRELFAGSEWGAKLRAAKSKCRK